MQTIQEIKDMVALLDQGVKSGLKMAEDGKLDLADVPAAFAFLQKLPAALAGAEKIPGEIKDLTEEQVAELVAFAVTDLGIPDGKAQHIVEHSLKVLAATFGLVKAIRE